MSDITELGPRGDAGHHQFRAMGDMYRWFQKRRGELDRKCDYSIKRQTGVAILDMRKSYKLSDVVDFYLFEDLSPKAANQN